MSLSGQGSDTLTILQCKGQAHPIKNCPSPNANSTPSGKTLAEEDSLEIKLSSQLFFFFFILVTIVKWPTTVYV